MTKKNKNTVIILVHGFNVEDSGKRTIDKLRYPLEKAGFEIDELNYPVRAPIIFDILLTRVKNDDLAQILHDKVKFHKKNDKQVIVIGHSNGYTIAHMASQLSVKYAPDVLIGINPALKKHLAPGKGVKQSIIYHSKSDSTVRWGKFLTYITLNPETRPWGTMGRVGYHGEDKRMENVDLEELYLSMTGRHRKVKHSSFFKDPFFKYFTQDLIERIK